MYTVQFTVNVFTVNVYNTGQPVGGTGRCQEEDRKIAYQLQSQAKHPPYHSGKILKPE